MSIQAAMPGFLKEIYARNPGYRWDFRVIGSLQPKIYIYPEDTSFIAYVYGRGEPIRCFLSSDEAEQAEQYAEAVAQVFRDGPCY